MPVDRWDWKSCARRSSVGAVKAIKWNNDAMRSPRRAVYPRYIWSPTRPNGYQQAVPVAVECNRLEGLRGATMRKAAHRAEG
jgi:hypothetical protein